MASIDEQISKTKERLKALEEKKRAQETKRRAKEAKLERARDTRRKVLVGAVVLGRVSRGELPETQLKEWLDKALTRADERALFDLTPLPASPTTDAPPVSAAKPASTSTPAEPKQANQEPPKERSYPRRQRSAWGGTPSSFPEERGLE